MLRAWLVASLAVVVTSSVSLEPERGQAAQAEAPRARVVLGYYVPYDTTSWASLRAHVDQMDYVGAHWVMLNGCGNLRTNDDVTLKEFAHSRSVKVLPSLLTGSAELNHQVLADDDTAAHAVEQIVEYTTAEGYDGFDLDMEAVAPKDRAYLARFVGWLADALHASDKLLTLAVPAKTSDVTVGWAGAYDYAALGAAADLVTIMAYEYRGPFSGPGSVAPFDWVQRVAAFAASQIPPDKVLLGLAFYGYDWNVSSGGARAIGYPQFLALASNYEGNVELDPSQRSATFGYCAVAGEQPPAAPIQPQPIAPQPKHQIKVRQPPPCDFVVPQPTPTPPPSEPEPGTPQEHRVWYEDSQSALARLDLVEAYGLSGVATWRLGLEDPSVWLTFDEWRQASQRQRPAV